MLEALAHRRAAEDRHLGKHKVGAAGHLDLDCAPQPRFVEQDQLLRKPKEGALRAKPEPHIEARIGSERAIDLLCRGTGDGKSRAIAKLDGEDRKSVV